MAVFAPSTTENSQAALKYWAGLSPRVTGYPQGKSCGLVSVCELLSKKGGGKNFKNICVRNCFFAQGIIVDFWYPTTQHCDPWETISSCYFLGSLLNLPSPFPKLLIQQKFERPMGLNRRGGLSHLISLLHSPITHVVCWAVRKKQGPFFPLPSCFWTDSQRSTFSYLWLKPESAEHVLSLSQHFPPESLQLFHSNLIASDNQTSILKIVPGGMADSKIMPGHHALLSFVLLDSAGNNLFSAEADNSKVTSD